METAELHPDNAETRGRLLQAAGEVFAEQGFREATIREICRRAGNVNVAAVNYHFGNKERLYAEVLRFAHGCAMTKYPAGMGLEPHATPEQRLHAFVRSFLFRIFDEGRPAWHGRLVAKEIADPTAALDQMVTEGIRPNFEMLKTIVADLLGHAGGGSDPDRVRNCAFSIVGQCLFYFHGGPIIARLHPGQQFRAEDIEALARHITGFSLAAVENLARCPPGALSAGPADERSL
jgi:AcrR family transcriptional regulator